METMKNHGMKFMLTQSFKIPVQHKKVSKIKDLLFEHQQILNSLHKDHRRLQNFSKRINIQELPTVEEFHQNFLAQLEQFNRRRIIYGLFPILGRRYILGSILFWLLESADGIYRIYDVTNLEIDNKYRDNLNTAVCKLYANIIDTTKDHGRLQTQELIELVKLDFQSVLSNLSSLHVRICHDEQMIKYSLNKINEKRQAL
jgi:hypothetical protein